MLEAGIEAAARTSSLRLRLRRLLFIVLFVYQLYWWIKIIVSYWVGL